jgi:hypothetical protein
MPSGLPAQLSFTLLPTYSDKAKEAQMGITPNVSGLAVSGFILSGFVRFLNKTQVPG